MISLIGENLKQWEKGRKVKIDCEKAFNEMHFSRMGDAEALVVEIVQEGDIYTAAIPNILLQTARMIKVELVYAEIEAETVIDSCEFIVNAKARPADYVYTETEIKTYKALEERIATLEKNGATQEVIKNAVQEYLKENDIGKQSPSKISEVTLLANAWVGESNLYSQVVTSEGVTPNSQVDLTPSVEQLAIFYEKDLTLVTENENGIVTVYAIGQKPTNDYTVQVTITEVEYE